MLLRPIELLQIWTGGLSFHGGLAGVVLASVLFAREHRVPWRRLADGLVLSAPFAILLVRCANFVNAELYGRVAPAWVPWAMRFPTDPAAARVSPELKDGPLVGGRLARPGTLAGLFLLGYAAARFLVEFTRQPDAQFAGPGNALGTVFGPLSMGQVLSLGVALRGVALLWWRPRARGPGGGAGDGS